MGSQGKRFLSHNAVRGAGVTHRVLNFSVVMALRGMASSRLSFWALCHDVRNTFASACVEGLWMP